MARTHTVIASPLGDLTAVTEDGALSGLYFEGHLRGPEPGELGAYVESGFDEARRQLDQYFAGERTCFVLPLAPPGR